jgi:type II secretion system protein N
MPTPSPSPVPRRASWRRKLLWAGAGLVVLLVAVYFVVSSSAFFTSVILSRVGAAVGGQVTVAEVAFSPFSHVYLRQLKVKTPGAEPLLEAEEVRLRYSLFSILGGNLKLDEVTVVSPVVQIIQNPDGTSNLDPLLKKPAKPSGQPGQSNSNAPSKPLQIELKDVAVKNATFRVIRNLKGGGRDVGEWTGVNINLDQLINGHAGKITTAASFKMVGPTNDMLEAKSAGNIEFTLGADLIPRSLKANVDLEILRAEGRLRDLAGVRTVFVGDITPTEVKEISQRFLRGGQLLGEMKITGPFDMSKKTGHLKLEVAGVDSKVLNLLGAPMGLDFGASTINCASEVTLTEGGSIIAANTQFSAANFTVIENGQSTPAVDLQWACDIGVNTDTQSAIVQAFTLDATQNKKPLLHGKLAKPMTLGWGDKAPAGNDSDFELSVTNLDFADWKPLLGETNSTGRLSAQVNVASGQGGREVKFGVMARIDGFAAKLGGTPLDNGALSVKLKGQANDFKKFTLSAYSLGLTEQAQPILTISGTANYETNAFTMQSKVEAVTARLLGSGPATPMSVGMNVDGSFANQVLDLRQLQLTFAPTWRVPTNQVQVAGNLAFLAGGKIEGSLALTAKTLDFTPLYDAFTGEKHPTTTQTAATPAPSPSAPANVEPEPMEFPLNLSVDADLAQVYLREIAITNWQTKLKLEGGKINLDPCRMTLNGGAFNTSVDLNLAVKGYAYALALQMDRVPMEPIANSFSPESGGQYKGLIVANAKIKGAGTTGSSLHKNLEGQVSLTFTNASIQLLGAKPKKMIDPIANLLRVSEITDDPVNWVDANLQFGGGNIKLESFTVLSAAFEAQTHGVIPIAEVLTNSPLNLPIEFSLRRSLAEQLGLLAADTPTNATYALLPRFVTIEGSIGDPKSDIDRKVLGNILLQSGAGIGKHVGTTIGRETGSLFKKVGGWFGGKKSGNSNQTNTNAPSGSR